MNGPTNHPALARTRTALAAVTCAMLGAACSATSTGSPATTPAANRDTVESSAPTIPSDTRSLTEQVGAFSVAWVGFVGSVVVGEPDETLADEIAQLYDPAMATIDAGSLTTCVTSGIGRLAGPPDSMWEHSLWQDRGGLLNDGAAPQLGVITVVDNLAGDTADGPYDGSILTNVVAGQNGLVGMLEPLDADSANPDHLALLNCLNEASTRTPDGDAALDRVQATLGDESLWATLDVSGFEAPVTFNVLSDNTDPVAPSETANEEFTSRPGFPADPADPEPIQSTGSNNWDLITADDPTAFERLESLGSGTVEFLPGDGDGGYTSVDDAYLYRAHFTDGTTIDIRVHPAIGTQADADAEVQKYLVPLGQLPTVLRRDIGTLSVVVGERTASASPGEGITVRTENVQVRLGDNRLEETLFHESVHTSLDQTYSYQRSAEWMDAQEADGRFIAEYARENPDGEDLAETALYAFALTYHPERFPDGVADELRARVPNRLAFIEVNIFPVGQPWIEE